MKRKNALILSVVWLLVLASIVASAVTLLATGGMAGRRWVSARQAQMIERYARLDAVRAALADDYYVEVDEDLLLEGAIRGMMAALGDPYTFYYTAEEMAAHNEQAGGEYQGLGLLVQSDASGSIEVVRVYRGGPAEAAGVRAGDRIEAVDGVKVGGEAAELEDVVEMMRGGAGETAELSLVREGQRLTITVERGGVSAPSVESAMLPGGIGYIRIFQFSGDDVEGFREALDMLTGQQARGLVIDLRDNPGGNLDDVVAIADELLGAHEIVYLETRDGSRKDYYSDASCCALPLAVLINGASASASEILAAAVQDLDRGTLVGERSFGKGIVQTLVTFESDGAGMQYTSAQYFTPSGKNIHGVGVTPDILVESDYVNSSGEPRLEEDIQLQTAVACVSGEIADAAEGTGE